MNDFTENNKNLWNEWAKIHTSDDSEIYQIKAFKEGQTSLKNIELNELQDVKNKSLLHLQCHFGLDTLSWARLGALVTGVDFSKEAIDKAQQLSDECKIPANFLCSNIYELPNILNKKYDIVYTSYGVLNWLNDLDKWAEIIVHFLKPGGTFYIVEFHPFAYMFDEKWLTIKEPYFYSNKPIATQERGSYANKDADFLGISYEWPHPLSEVITALIKAGLVIELFHEFPYTPHNCFPLLEQNKTGEYIVKNRMIPLTYSIKAIYQQY